VVATLYSKIHVSSRYLLGIQTSFVAATWQTKTATTQQIVIYDLTSVIKQRFFVRDVQPRMVKYFVTYQ